MASDSRLPVVIFVSLVVLIATPFLLSSLRESRRPVMVEARVVTATSADPVFRDGRRQVAADDEVQVGLALRLERRGREDLWIAPAAELMIGGEHVEHQQATDWLEEDRHLRVFWFTIESANIGGELTAPSAEILRYRSFLAPEMGRGLLAVRLPSAHNDDHLGQGEATAPSSAGTFRLYARVEVVEEEKDVRPLQQVATLDADHIFDAEFPAILRAADLGAGVNNAAGELFLLPGFEPKGSSPDDRNRVTVPIFGRLFTEMVEERLVVSSWTLAAVAVSGSASLDPASLTPLGKLSISIDSIRRNRRPLRWGRDVLAGDLLVDGDHWLILLRDQGDGLLDQADTVLHCWGRPPVITTLLTAMREDVAEMAQFRHDP
jgi:hypothetical protein